MIQRNPIFKHPEYLRLKELLDDEKEAHSKAVNEYRDAVDENPRLRSTVNYLRSRDEYCRREHTRPDLLEMALAVAVGVVLALFLLWLVMPA